MTTKERFASSAFSDFRDITELYRSQTGAVYRASFRYDNKEYILKERKLPELGRRKDIMNEVKLLLQLSHANVVRCEGWFRDELRKSLFIVLEYCDGGDLYKLIQYRKTNHAPFEERQIWYIFNQICQGLKHLHENGIIHRDLKALNILMTRRGRVFKIGDLGVSRQVSEETMMLNTFYGTPLYLSPELVENKPYNEKTDMWSLGILLYEMTTFNVPFKANTILALAKSVLRGKYEPINNHYSKHLHKCIAWLLQLDFAKRPNVIQLLEFVQGRLSPDYYGQNLGQLGVSESTDNLELIPPPNSHFCKNKSRRDTANGGSQRKGNNNQADANDDVDDDDDSESGSESMDDDSLSGGAESQNNSQNNTDTGCGGQHQHRNEVKNDVHRPDQKGLQQNDQHKKTPSSPVANLTKRDGGREHRRVAHDAPPQRQQPQTQTQPHIQSNARQQQGSDNNRPKTTNNHPNRGDENYSIRPTTASASAVAVNRQPFTSKNTAAQTSNDKHEGKPCHANNTNDSIKASKLVPDMDNLRLDSHHSQLQQEHRRQKAITTNDGCVPHGVNVPSHYHDSLQEHKSIKQERNGRRRNDSPSHRRDHSRSRSRSKSRSKSPSQRKVKQNQPPSVPTQPIALDVKITVDIQRVSNLLRRESAQYRKLLSLRDFISAAPSDASDPTAVAKDENSNKAIILSKISELHQVIVALEKCVDSGGKMKQSLAKKLGLLKDVPETHATPTQQEAHSHGGGQQQSSESKWSSSCARTTPKYPEYTVHDAWFADRDVRIATTKAYSPNNGNADWRQNKNNHVSVANKQQSVSTIPAVAAKAAEAATGRNDGGGRHILAYQSRPQTASDINGRFEHKHSDLFAVNVHTAAGTDPHKPSHKASSDNNNQHPQSQPQQQAQSQSHNRPHTAAHSRHEVPSNSNKPRRNQSPQRVVFQEPLPLPPHLMSEQSGLNLPSFQQQKQQQQQQQQRRPHSAAAGASHISRYKGDRAAPQRELHSEVDVRSCERQEGEGPGTGLNIGSIADKNRVVSHRRVISDVTSLNEEKSRIAGEKGLFSKPGGVKQSRFNIITGN